MFLKFLNRLTLIYCDSPEKWQMGLQDPATPSMEGMIFFNSFLTIILITIGVFVCWMLLKVLTFFVLNKNIQKFTHSSLLEIVWTLVPAVILLIIAVPSFSLLY